MEAALGLKSNPAKVLLDPEDSAISLTVETLA